ncbi:protease complex subunit PrcB family protein [Flavobacteriaceae bacterium]|nr:protease complex subunit PrcB family protein [Flavobacteriaceae bacterium]
MRLILCVFLFGVLGCSSTIQPSKTLKKEEIVFNTISKGVLFGNGIEGILEEKFTITNEKQWQVFLNKINSVNNVSSSFSEININFSNHNIICVFDTIRNTGGYAIEIERIFIEKKNLNIVYNKKEPGPMEMVTTIITQPYHIVKIQKRGEDHKFITKN